jgi:hypothetical protein
MQGIDHLLKKIINDYEQYAACELSDLLDAVSKYADNLDDKHSCCRQS